MSDAHKLWISYCRSELMILTPLLRKHGYELAENQPHLKGERYLQQAVTTESGRKLILYATHQGYGQVVIKTSRDKAGKRELKHERKCRKLLNDIDFAAEVFKTPTELAWIEKDGFIVSVQKFITQPRTFLEHTLPEQFELALNSFKAQEGAHATTYGHIQQIKKTYEIRDSSVYIKNFEGFQNHTKILMPKEVQVLDCLQKTYIVLKEKVETIEQYCGFLTHTDFVPHNLRIDSDETVYLLDHSSLTFGNKHEGWARFLNFMALYNPELTALLTKYVIDNRSREETNSLWLMRLYRLGEIIFYYAKAQASSNGELKSLNQTRVVFWSTVLDSLLKHESVPESVIKEYRFTRDKLRSEDEKERQKGLH